MEAFNTIYRLYFNRLLQYGVLLHEDRKAVEDTIQEFFIWLYKHPEKLENIKRFDLYLFSSIKQNLYALHARTQKSQTAFHRFLATQYQETFDYTCEETLIEQEHKAVQKTYLDTEIESLPSHLREILYLRYYEGLSYEEISEILSVSQQVARNYVSRAIKRIRRQIPSFILAMQMIGLSILNLLN